MRINKNQKKLNQTPISGRTSDNPKSTKLLKRTMRNNLYMKICLRQNTTNYSMKQRFRRDKNWTNLLKSSKKRTQPRKNKKSKTRRRKRQKNRQRKRMFWINKMFKLVKLRRMNSTHNVLAMYLGILLQHILIKLLTKDRNSGQLLPKAWQKQSHQ